MYPNLYYVLKDWFGVEWKKLEVFNTFGIMVALAFVAAAVVLSKELQRKEKQGLLTPREETITVGQAVTFLELIINAVVGFIFGYKIFGLLFTKPETVSAQEYIFSNQGNMIGGIVIALLLTGLKWWDKNKQKLKEPERRTVRIWPHDRVGDMVVLALVFGLLGAKLFDNLEHWDTFVKDPIGSLFSASGLTFYGGLILAAIAITWYALKKGIKLFHLMDAIGPALIIAYAIGRIGCQLAGDGDWGIYNSAYVNDASGKVTEAKPGQFQQNVNQNIGYFKTDRAFISDSAGQVKVKHASFKGPSFLPTWIFAYPYPQNVNKEGIAMPDCSDEHCAVLPAPVYPTPFYETIMGFLIFFFLWAIRRRIKTPGMIFAIYLVLNGVERFLIELIRVNNRYTVFGFKLSQAELIALGLIAIGFILAIIMRRKAR